LVARDVSAVLLCAILSACGGEAAPVPATENSPALASTPQVRRPTEPETSGAPKAADAQPQSVPATSPPLRAFLEHPASLRRFYEALAALEDKTPSADDVRLIQIGDSHTAADWYTGVVRRMLQARFGDGGRGFVAVGKPWKGYVQDGIRVGMTAEWAPEHAKFVHGRVVGDGLYGLSGVAVSCQKRGGSAWVEGADADRVDLAYLAQPGGGPFDLLIDGASVVRVATKADGYGVKFRGLDVEPGTHRVEVQSAGNGKVRILGAALDKKAKGIVLDAFGRDGARAANLLQWNAEHVSELLKWRAPSLVILQFGTNECTDKDVSAAQYERELAEVVGRIVRAAPASSCLLLGPPDFVVYGAEGPAPHPRLAEILAVQRRVAEAAQCGFYDQVAAMGGLGAIAAWAQENPPRARKDGVHLSRDGYTNLATSFVDEILRGYAAYRLEHGKSAPPAVALRQ
jgi:lysophospholipase L1-like esterase